jgi:hypothetical protein
MSANSAVAVRTGEVEAGPGLRTQGEAVRWLPMKPIEVSPSAPTWAIRIRRWVRSLPARRNGTQPWLLMPNKSLGEGSRA